MNNVVLNIFVLALRSVLPLLLRYDNIPQHDSILTGHRYYLELMNTANVHRFLNINRMDKQTFLRLVTMLTSIGMLKDSLTICSGQKVMIFIQALIGHSNRQSAERWQHSGSTISVILHEVVDSLYRCLGNCFFRPTAGDELSSVIQNNSKFFPFFANCIGALDGTHIPAIVEPTDQGRYRNRKGFISQNVLVVVNFDMTFSYALAGWEGSAHDSKVYDDSKLKGFPHIPHKFYLGDAGYALSTQVLTPYRGIRYHLKEWVAGRQRPQNKEELFNLRHSSLRNVVERLLGVTKKRFPILELMGSYAIQFQAQLIMCCLMIHNFIRANQLYEDEFYAVYDREQQQYRNEEHEEFADENDANYNALVNQRDQIAQDMYDAYLVELAHRGIY